MVPRQAGLGRSFKGAGAYYLHDKAADTSERVAFTHTENIPTQDPEKALKWMAWTAIHAEELKRESGAKATGQPCTKPVFTFSLAWHPEQEPQEDEMIGAGRRALIALGLEDHETLMVAHSETDHPHIHLITNTVHPETGLVNTLSFSKLKLSKWAEEYEREHGKIYCEQRVENNEQREQSKFVKYREPELDHKTRITELYHASDSGKAFQEALAQAGYQLAQGKRLVVIDQEGNLHSLSRQVEGVKAKDIRAKLGDLELQSVDEARALARNQDAKTENKSERQEILEQAPQAQDSNGQEEKKDDSAYVDREQDDRDWQESIIEAAITTAEKESSQPKTDALLQTIPSRLLNAIQDRHHAELGRFYDENNQARLRLASRLDEQYGAHERALRRDAEHLEHILKDSGRFRLWWLKVTRQIPKTAEEDLKSMRLSLDSIGTSKSEAQQAFENEINQRRQTLEVRHKQEKMDLRPDSAETTYDCERVSNESDDNPEVDEDFGPSLGY